MVIVRRMLPCGLVTLSSRPQSRRTVRQAVMVGDSGIDIATARAAGVPIVAVDFGYSETPVRDLGADRLISHFDELAGAVLELMPAMR